LQAKIKQRLPRHQRREENEKLLKQNLLNNQQKKPKLRSTMLEPRKPVISALEMIFNQREI